MSSKIFISYRRDDSAGHAGRIRDRLSYDLGKGDLIFMDVDSIPLGLDFIKHIEHEVSSCDVLLAIIGNSWMNFIHVNQPDFVSIEISAALKRDIPVVPILIENAKMPSADALPENLKPLAYRNGMNIRNASFDSDIQKLTAFVRQFVTRSSTKSNVHNTTTGPSVESNASTAFVREFGTSEKFAKYKNVFAVAVVFIGFLITYNIANNLFGEDGRIIVLLILLTLVPAFAAFLIFTRKNR